MSNGGWDEKEKVGICGGPNCRCVMLPNKDTKSNPMREHLVAFIKGFQDSQDGGGNGSNRHQISLGNSGELLLTFGYGYYSRKNVLVTSWLKDSPEYIEPKLAKREENDGPYLPLVGEMETEKAVDLFIKHYRLEDKPIGHA